MTKKWLQIATTFVLREYINKMHLKMMTGFYPTLFSYHLGKKLTCPLIIPLWSKTLGKIPDTTEVSKVAGF